MKITPLDIRQQQFEKGFRGYSTESVDAYLTSLSQEWERVLEENRLLKDRLERTEADYAKLKALENTLYKTIQLAETASQDATSKAEAEASERLKSARTESDELLGAARKQASMLLMDAENKSRYLIDEAIDELKALERDYKAIEKFKDQLVKQLKEYANDALGKVQRFEEKHLTGFEAKYSELKAVPTTAALDGTALDRAALDSAAFPEAPEDTPAPTAQEEDTFPTDPEAPTDEDSGTEVPGAEASDTEAPGAETSGVDTSEVKAKAKSKKEAPSESFFDKN